VIAIAVAVLQYHLYDVRLVIRRVVVYGGLTIALTALFVGVYFAVLAALSGQVMAARYRWVAVAVATAAVLAAEPARRRIQIRLERRFLGERGDPLGVLARLHAALSSGNEDENTAYATITRTVAHAVRSPSVALALHRGPQIETVSITGAEQNGPPALDLPWQAPRAGIRASRRYFPMQWEDNLSSPRNRASDRELIRPVRAVPPQCEENTDVHSPLALIADPALAAGRVGLLLVASRIPADAQSNQGGRLRRDGDHDRKQDQLRLVGSINYRRSPGQRRR
jgi:hypothetical protein